MPVCKNNPNASQLGLDRSVYIYIPVSRFIHMIFFFYLQAQRGYIIMSSFIPQCNVIDLPCGRHGTTSAGASTHCARACPTRAAGAPAGCWSLLREGAPQVLHHCHLSQQGAAAWQQQGHQLVCLLALESNDYMGGRPSIFILIHFLVIWVWTFCCSLYMV